MTTNTLKKLKELSKDQMGAFAVQQAQALGIKKEELEEEIQAKTITELSIDAPGVYQINSYYPSEARFLEYEMWSLLWSCNAEGVPMGTLGFQSALRLHGFRRIDPIEKQIIVPHNFEPFNPASKCIRVIHGDVPENDKTIVDGLSATSFPKSLVDTYNRAIVGCQNHYPIARLPESFAGKDPLPFFYFSHLQIEFQFRMSQDPQKLDELMHWAQSRNITEEVLIMVQNLNEEPMDPGIG